MDRTELFEYGLLGEYRHQDGQWAWHPSSKKTNYAKVLGEFLGIKMVSGRGTRSSKKTNYAKVARHVLCGMAGRRCVEF